MRENILLNRDRSGTCYSNKIENLLLYKISNNITEIKEKKIDKKDRFYL